MENHGFLDSQMSVHHAVAIRIYPNYRRFHTNVCEIHEKHSFLIKMKKICNERKNNTYRMPSPRDPNLNGENHIKPITSESGSRVFNPK